MASSEDNWSVFKSTKKKDKEGSKTSQALSTGKSTVTSYVPMDQKSSPLSQKSESSESQIIIYEPGGRDTPEKVKTRRCPYFRLPRCCRKKKYKKDSDNSNENEPTRKSKVSCPCFSKDKNISETRGSSV